MDDNPTGHDPPASELLGKFRLDRKLGKGGMGAVYLAFDPVIERQVALKILTKELSQNSISLQRFLTEAKSVGKLNHPNVIGIYDIAEDRGDHYIVMELAEGGSIGDRLRSGEPLPLAEACRITLEAARGLKAAHDVGLIHRDVKPDNLMLTKEGVVKLVDFGLSKYVDQSADLSLTRTGQVLGTPVYMSPEQIKTEPLNVQTDIYSLGATFFHLLTGEAPFLSNSYAGLVFAHLEAPRPDPLEFIPAAPAALKDIIARAMAVDPRERYTTMADFISDLQQISSADDDTIAGKHPSADPGDSTCAQRKQAPCVLIAEPSRLGAKVLSDQFAKAGCRVLDVVADRESGLAAAKATRIDLVVAARRLSDAPGRVLVEQIRQLEGNAMVMGFILTSDSPHDFLAAVAFKDVLACVCRRAKPVEILGLVEMATELELPGRHSAVQRTQMAQSVAAVDIEVASPSAPPQARQAIATWRDAVNGVNFHVADGSERQPDDVNVRIEIQPANDDVDPLAAHAPQRAATLVVLRPTASGALRLRAISRESSCARCDIPFTEDCLQRIVNAHRVS